MSITVTCPKCGRSIKAKKKFVLSTGGVPCLRCKVRIPVSREQVEAMATRDTLADDAAEAPLEAVTAPQAEAPPVESEPEIAPPVRQETPPPVEAPIPEMPATPEAPPVDEPPAAEMVAASDFSNDDDSETITAAIATEPTPEPAQAEAPAAAGAQIVFTCPYCQTNYPVRQGLAGKKIRCKGCSRIVKVAADSPAVPGNEPPPPPPPPPIEDDIPVVYSTPPAPVPEPPAPPPPAPLPPAPTPPPAPAARPAPQPAAFTPSSGNENDVISSLKRALADAEERASSAEEMLQKTNLDKFNNEMTAFRKIRDLEAQIRELTLQMKSQEGGPGTLKRADVESLLKGLCDELDSNLAQELVARKNLLEDLKRQLAQALK